MIEKLIDISELMALLGCSDERTVANWCKEKKVPIIKMGKKKYIVRTFLDLFINEELKKFVLTKFQDPDEVMTAITSDDKVRLAELLSAPVAKSSAKEYASKIDSKAAQDYINKFKAA